MNFDHCFIGLEVKRSCSQFLVHFGIAFSLKVDVLVKRGISVLVKGILVGK